MRIAIKFCVLYSALLLACETESLPMASEDDRAEAAGLRPGAGSCPTRPLRAGDHDITIKHEGIDHTFKVHVPSSVDRHKPAPVVLFYHGGNGTADGQEAVVKLLPVADEHGFVLVRGEGYPTLSGSGQVWNAGACCGIAADTATQSVDHVGATSAFLDELETRLCVDRRRVFATGHSNGGMLAYRLACELSDRVAAIAPNAAFLMNRDLDAEQVTTLFSCEPTRPVPVLQLHGLADQCAPIGGGESAGHDPATRPTVRSGIEVLRVANGCRATPTVTRPDDTTTCFTWGDCTAGADVILCAIDGAGHTWPGSFYPAETQGTCGGAAADLDANQMIWEFFAAHPMP
jgi:polyhydroxybutyrate depolymerase